MLPFLFKNDCVMKKTKSPLDFSCAEQVCAHGLLYGPGMDLPTLFSPFFSVRCWITHLGLACSDSDPEMLPRASDGATKMFDNFYVALSRNQSSVIIHQA